MDRDARRAAAPKDFRALTNPRQQAAVTAVTAATAFIGEVATLQALQAAHEDLRQLSYRAR